MIKTLYQPFRKWSERGSVWIISDTHFDDPDCQLMDKNWITPEQHIKNLKCVSKNDFVIHLGDVGNPEYLEEIKGQKILVMGNHDKGASVYEPYFDEIYTGALIVAEKLILSHEPINIPWLFNIHGHDHDPTHKGDRCHLNLASNVVGYRPYSLGKLIEAGLLKYVKSLHRITIDEIKGDK